MHLDLVAQPGGYGIRLASDQPPEERLVDLDDTVGRAIFLRRADVPVLEFKEPMVGLTAVRQVETYRSVHLLKPGVTSSVPELFEELRNRIRHLLSLRSPTTSDLASPGQFRAARDDFASPDWGEVPLLDPGPVATHPHWVGPNHRPPGHTAVVRGVPSGPQRVGVLSLLDPTEEFFTGLNRTGYGRLPEKVSGTIRFEVNRDDQIDTWFVKIDQGNVSVSREKHEADAVVRIRKPVFDLVARGERHPVAARLRNQMTSVGDLALLRYFERLLPGPPGSHDPRRFAVEPAVDYEENQGEGNSGEDGADAVSDGEPADSGVVGGKLVNILNGNIFLVSDGRGDIDPSPTYPTGLFSFDTRFLSTWHLSINGQRVHALSVDNLQYYETRFFLVPGVPTHYVDAKLSVIRHRWIGGSFEEELRVLNHENVPADLRIRVEAGSDFADLFEIKDVRPKIGRHYARPEDDCLRLGYEREEFRRETVISTTAPAEFDERGLTYNVRIGPHEEWVARILVKTLGADGRDVRTSLTGQPRRTMPELRQDLDAWLQKAPHLVSDSESLKDTYQRSLVDLAALRYSPLVSAGRALPAAGLPWFMTVFGRDSIITSLQALPFTPELAATTLEWLGMMQGSKLDDFRDEEPGKILHEVRYGEQAAFEEQPHSRYFGTADATPLYLVLLDEYERWSGDGDLVRRFEHEARAALDWIGTYGDILGNGYIWYQRRNRKKRAGKPVLEGLLGRYLLSRRPVTALPESDLRIAGLCIRCQSARRSPRPRVLGRSGVRRPTGTGSGGTENALQPRLLGGGRPILRARAGHRGQAGGRDVVEHGSPALERHRRIRTGRANRRTPGRAAIVLRLGRADAGQGGGTVQPRRLPRGHSLAFRQFPHRLGTAPIRLRRTSRADRQRDP